MSKRPIFHTGRHRTGKRHPERIGEVMSQLLARTGYAQSLASTDWQDIWIEAAGPQWSGQSRSGRLRRGVLEVIVRNSTVLQELSFRKKELLEKIRNRLPDQTVHDIRFRVGQLD